MPKESVALIAESPTLPVLWHNVVRAFRLEGFLAGSFHPLRGFESVPAIRPITFGYQRDILQLYLDREFYALDATPRAIMPSGKVMTWREAWESLHLTADEQQFWNGLQIAGSDQGLSLPCYGPKQRNAYVTLSRHDRDRQFDLGERRWLQVLAQTAHMRLCELLFTADAAVTLSPREKEILHWVALGKSNSVISQLVRISGATVDTHLRRIFSKMGVADRTSAAIKAIGLGLIH